MLRAAIAGLMLVATGAVASLAGGVLASGEASAQWGALFGNDGYGKSYKRPSDGFLGDDYDTPRRPKRSLWTGGSRPYIAPLAPDRISLPSEYPVGSIVIDHKGRQLFFIESPTTALRYPISVGKEGFGWTGTQKISKIVSWPDWRPPASMRARDPRLPVHMTGGLKNPLGAKALYLGNTLYRIHGTNDPKSIGRASSSGCFRMLNGHVVDLASRVDIGSTVIVVRRLPSELAYIVSTQVATDVVPEAVSKAAPHSAPKSSPRPGRRPPVLDDLFGEEMPSMDDFAGEGAGAPDRLF